MNTTPRLAGIVAVIAAVMLAAPWALGQGVPDQFAAWGRQAADNQYLGDPALDAPGTTPAQASDAEKAAGFFLFTKPISTVITPDYAPTQQDRCKELSAADCRGQYGPVTFFVYATKKGDFGVKVSDLAGPSGKKIASSNLDVRVVRYAKVDDNDKKPGVTPLLLEAFGSKIIQQDRFAQFWITYYVPKNAAAGVYEGTVTITPDGKEAAKLPLKLEVYGFDLQQPQVNFFIFHQGPGGLPKDLLAKQLTDMRCHGMTMDNIGAPTTDAGDLKKPEMDALLDAYKASGLGPNLQIDLYNRIISEWVPEDKTTKPPMWGAWFRYYPFSDKLDKRYVETVKYIDEQATKRGIKVMIEDADEPGSHPWTQEAAAHYNKVLKENLPKVTRELSCGGGWALKYDEDKLWGNGLINVWTVNRYLPDKFELVYKTDPKAIIQLCNMAGSGSVTGSTQASRNAHGLFIWKAKMRGQAQWAYNAQNSFAYVWNAAEESGGPVPTLRWEAAREGTKDYAYMHTLQQAMARNPKAKTAKDAQALIDKIASAIELRSEVYDVISGGRVPAPPPGTFEQWRAEMAKAIIDLQAK